MNPDSYLDMFAKDTTIVCVCLILAIIFIIVFLVTPIRYHLVYSRIFKGGAIILLIYALATNLHLAYKCFTDFNNVPDNLKPNLECSCFFSLFIAFLIISLF